MNRLSRFLLASATLLALACTFAPAGAYAADTADNATINQDYPNGSGSTDSVPTHIVFSSNNAGQDITVLPSGLLGINPVVKGNLTATVVASGSAVSLVTATPKTVTSVTVGIGTWRVYGYIDYVLAAASTTLTQSGFGTTTNSFTNTLQAQDISTTAANTLTTATATLQAATPFLQFTVTSGTQQVFLVADQTFSAGTVTAYGTLFSQQVK